MQIEWGHTAIETGLGLSILWTSVKTYLALRENRPHSHTEDDGFEDSGDTKLTVRGIRYSRTMDGGDKKEAR